MVSWDVREACSGQPTAVSSSAGPPCGDGDAINASGRGSWAKKIPRIQEKYVTAGSSENAIQRVIGYGGGGSSDKIFLQIIQFGINTAG